MTWRERLKGFTLGLMVLVGVVGALFVAIGLMRLTHNVSCDRLNEKRVAHLEPGHDVPGPDSIYVTGVGPGPPKSEILPYLEAEAAMQRAGCDLPGTVHP